MAIMVFGVNIAAIITASIVCFAFGALWHSPLGFVNQWVKLMGYTKKDIEKGRKQPMGGTYAAAFLVNLVTAFSLGWFVNASVANTATLGAGIGALAWLGFVATTTLNGVLWERKSMALWRFSNAYLLLHLMLMGAILGGWG